MTRRATLYALAVASALAAAVVVFAVIANEWLAPSTALIVGGIGYAVFVGAWAAGLTADDADQGTESGPSSKVGLAAAAAAGLLIPGAAGAWTTGTVRASLTGAVAGGQLASVERVLADRASEVRLSLCREVLVSAPTKIPVLQRRMRAAPRLAAKCVRNAQSASDGRRKRLAEGLVANWRGRLVGGEQRSAGTCRHLRATLALQSYLGEGSGELLFRCSVGGASDALQSCCRKELEQRGTDVSFGIEDRSPAELLGVLEDLVPVVFPSRTNDSATSMPAAFKGQEGNLREASVAAACRLVGEDDHRKVAGVFYDFAASDSCKPDEGTDWLTAFSAEKVWERTCRPLYGYARDQEGRKPADALCQSLYRSTVRRAVEAAKAELAFSVASVDQTKNRVAARIAATPPGAGRGAEVAGGSGGRGDHVGSTRITSFDSGGQNFLANGQVDGLGGEGGDDRGEKCYVQRKEMKGVFGMGSMVENKGTKVRDCRDKKAAENRLSKSEFDTMVKNITEGNYNAEVSLTKFYKQFDGEASQSLRSKAFEKMRKAVEQAEKNQ